MASPPTTSPEPATLVLSDVHLTDAWRGQIDALRGLFGDVERVVLNGDTLNSRLDYHPDLRPAVLDALRTAAGREGVELLLLAGNSDPRCSTIDHLLLAGGRVWVTHGHVLFNVISPWTHDRRAVRKRVEHFRAELAPIIPDPVERTFRAMRQTIIERHERYPFDHRSHPLLAGPMKLWREGRHVLQVPALGWALAVLPARAAGLARRCAPDARVVLLGHTHWPCCERAGGRWIVNTGSLRRPGLARAVRIDGKTLSLHAVRRRGRRLRLAGPSRQIDLASQAGLDDRPATA